MSDRLVNWFQFMVANPRMDGDEFDKNIATIKELVIIEWLDGQDVLCDCDNGIRFMPNPAYTTPCDRCSLVEFNGGIRVRWLRNGSREPHDYAVVLPAVEVTDE